MVLNLNTNKTRYLGTGSILLDNGRDIPLTITGSYTKKTDQTKLTLKGTKLDRSVSLSVSTICTNAEMVLRTLTGKAFGQSLKLPTAK